MLHPSDRCRVSSGYLIVERRRLRSDGSDDLGVAGAAAQVAGQPDADLLLGRRWVAASSAVADMIMPGVQNPHCTPPSSSRLPLQRVQLVADHHTLDGRDRPVRRPAPRGTSTS